MHSFLFLRIYLIWNVQKLTRSSNFINVQPLQNIVFTHFVSEFIAVAFFIRIERNRMIWTKQEPLDTRRNSWSDTLNRRDCYCGHVALQAVETVACVQSDLFWFQIGSIRRILWIKSLYLINPAIVISKITENWCDCMHKWQKYGYLGVMAFDECYTLSDDGKSLGGLCKTCCTLTSDDNLANVDNAQSACLLECTRLLLWPHLMFSSHKSSRKSKSWRKRPSNPIWNGVHGDHCWDYLARE